VPFQAGRHGQQISERNAILICSSQVGVLRKKRHDRLIEVLYPAAVNRYAQDQGRDALCNGAVIVLDLWTELYLAHRLT